MNFKAGDIVVATFSEFIKELGLEPYVIERILVICRKEGTVYGGLFNSEPEQHAKEHGIQCKVMEVLILKDVLTIYESTGFELAGSLSNEELAEKASFWDTVAE